MTLTDLGRRGRLITRIAWLIVVGIAVTSCGSSGDDEASDPTCVESKLADGSGFRDDPAMAIALSRAIEKGNPELSPIVDAVADYQLSNPDTATVHLDSIEDTSPLSSAIYVLTLTNLAARSDLATPDVLDAITQAAEDRSDGGISGVQDMILDSDHPANELAGDELDQLAALVVEQFQAIEEAGIEELPSPDCPPPSE